MRLRGATGVALDPEHNLNGHSGTTPALTPWSRAGYSEGFTRLRPSVATVVSHAIGMGLLSLSVRSLPLGTGYGMWTGIGAVGNAIAGIVLFREPATVARIACLTLIVFGIVGLKLLGR